MSAGEVLVAGGKCLRHVALAGWKWSKQQWVAHRTEVAYAICLLFLITVTHYAYDPLALLVYQDTSGAAARAIFYVLRGHEGFWLFLVVGVLARSAVLWPVCVFGMVEEAETALCRLGHPIASSAPYKMFTGLCGTEAYAAGVAAAAVLAFVLIRRKQ